MTPSLTPPMTPSLRDLHRPARSGVLAKSKSAAVSAVIVGVLGAADLLPSESSPIFSSSG